MTPKRPVGILISGRGSNMMALIRAAEDPMFPARIAVVLSNRQEAAGLARARAAGIPALAIDHRRFGRDREAHERAIDEALLGHDVAFVCLAGYLRLLTPWLVSRWQGRMLNIHPSLLPAYPGLDTHARALAAGESHHGCTVHLVTDAMDEGPVLGRAEVPVLAGDDETSLADRVLSAEHLLYPQTLKAFLEAAPLPAAPLAP